VNVAAGECRREPVRNQYRLREGYLDGLYVDTASA
jgi:hypothetical protein